MMNEMIDIQSNLTGYGGHGNGQSNHGYEYSHVPRSKREEKPIKVKLKNNLHDHESNSVQMSKNEGMQRDEYGIRKS